MDILYKVPARSFGREVLGEKFSAGLERLFGRVSFFFRLWGPCEIFRQKVSRLHARSFERSVDVSFKPQP